MAHMLETPSRIMRRIEARTGFAREMPSLPSLPGFEDSMALDPPSERSDDASLVLSDASAPITSTPTTTALLSQGGTTMQGRPRGSTPGSASATARFANSIAGRSSRSGRSSTHTTARFSIGRRSAQASFDDISLIPPTRDESRTPELSLGDELDLPSIRGLDSMRMPSLTPDLPDGMLESADEASLADALDSVSSRASTPPIESDDFPEPELDVEPTPRKNKSYDYSGSLRSAPKASPFEKYRNITARKPQNVDARTRTPSLSRDTPSPESSPGNSTPRSTTSFAAAFRAAAPSPLPAAAVPLPRSATASPALSFFRRSMSNPAERSGSPGVNSLVNQSTVDKSDGEVDLLRSPHIDSDEGTNGHLALPPSDVEDRTEPTFSSEEPTPAARQRGGGIAAALGSPATITGRRSPLPQSSPATSVAFTPTPAFPVRPRARFDYNPVTPAPHPRMAPVVHETIAEESSQSHADETATVDNTARPGAFAELQTPARFADDLATPFSRRRSFLLSVIHSTARPRLAAGTPRPDRIMESEEEMEEDESRATAVPAATPASTESVAATPAPAPAARPVFAGVTPLPRPRAQPRLSHPLAQAWTSTSSRVPSSGSSARASSLAPPTVSAHTPLGSPTDAAGMERASFISVTSSNDLTTHARANASFDPLMVGLGAQGHGVGRFNAGKLNSYLHGLNRRLQQENEGLMDELARIRDALAAAEAGAGDASVLGSVASAGRRRLSGVSAGSRRKSAGGSSLGDVEERSEERAAFEERMAELRDEITQAARERDAAQAAFEELALDRQTLRGALDGGAQQLADARAALADEEAARAADRAAHREQMRELQGGVQGIVGGLETRAADAEARAARAEDERARVERDLARMLAETEAERELAKERAERAEMALEHDTDLGQQLRDANERADSALGELRQASAQFKDLEDEVLRSERRADTLETELRRASQTIAKLEGDMASQRDEVVDARAALEKEKKVHARTQEQLARANECIAELEDDAGAALGRIQTLEQQLADADAEVAAAKAEARQAKAEADDLQVEADRAGELARELESALAATEQKLEGHEEEVAELRAEAAVREREVQRERSFSRLEPVRGAEFDALEAELDDAHREIAKLQTQMEQSPARKAIEHAKDAKIEMLEREREDLLERVKGLKNASMAFQTPSKAFAGGISPAHRHMLNMTFRTPKTPGGPLRDMSWLNASLADPSVAPFLAEINRLQVELDRANDSVDDKLEQLEDAGHGVIGLTKKLEDARGKISALETQHARLIRKEERRVHRLERARCGKCRTKVDLRGLGAMADGDESSILEASSVLPSEPPTPPTRTSEALRADLRGVNTELERMRAAWAAEKRQLLGENAALQDAADRLNAKARDAEASARRAMDAGARAKSGTEAELDKARAAVAEFENELKAERSRLRALSAEKTKAEREKEEVLSQLRRNESDIDDVKQQLLGIKEENHELEKELRVTANAEQKARLLERKVSENVDTIAQLRQERALLTTGHRDLQQQLAEVTDTVAKLRSEQTASQAAHDDHRAQLDAQAAEVGELRRALGAAGDARASAERAATRGAAALEADLARVRADAEAFGKDLARLRAERDTLVKDAERARAGERAARTDKDERTAAAERYREEARRVKRELEGHVCTADERQVSALKLQHNKECKGLIVQIRYLKAKFTREAALRADLGFQKGYLLVVLAQFERSEKRVLAAIAQVGFPVAPPTRPARRRHTLRKAALAVMFLLRTRRASDDWREQCRSKAAIAAALQDVRKRRTAAA